MLGKDFRRTVDFLQPPQDTPGFDSMQTLLPEHGTEQRYGGAQDQECRNPHNDRCQ